MPSEKNVVREGGLLSFKSRCQKVKQKVKMEFDFDYLDSEQYSFLHFCTTL